MAKSRHPLKQYLVDVNESYQDFAERVGASRQSLYRIVNGGQVPRPALAARIVEATGGAVTFNMLYDGQSSGRASVFNISSSRNEEALDYERLHMSLTIVVEHLSPEDHKIPPMLIHSGVEASTNTYCALSPVTTRHGQDRLAQALRPVLEEILRELDVHPGPVALDKGAELSAQLYYQTVPRRQVETL